MGTVNSQCVVVVIYALQWGEGGNHRVHRVAMATLGVHSIMRVKLAQAGEVGGARPPPFTISTITYNVKRSVQYAPAESADTHTLFLLYP